MYCSPVLVALLLFVGASALTCKLDEVHCGSRVAGKQCCVIGGAYCDPVFGCTTCPGGLPNHASCNGFQCTNLLTDRANCGMCKRACPAGHTCCDGSCYDLQSNTDNCGACGKNCDASDLCCSGKCVNTLDQLCPQ